MLAIMTSNAPWRVLGAHLARIRDAMVRNSRAGHASLAVLLLVGGVAMVVIGAPTSSIGLAFTGPATGPATGLATPHSARTDPEDVREILDTYCVRCHNERRLNGGLALDVLDVENPIAAADRWETVIRKLRTGTMPPGGVRRPDPAEYDLVASWLETEIDRAASAAGPNPGGTNPIHRLNRLEYNNAINDLLGLDVDLRSLLPGDETADGSFDNFADALSITTTHMERYMSLARQVTRLATGLPPMAPGVATFEVGLHVVQDQRQSEDLPFGSRGGISVRYDFPVDGEYLIKIQLRRQYQDYLMGMGWQQQLDLRLDGELLERFTVGGGATQFRAAAASYAGAGEPGSAGASEWEEYMQMGGDAHLEVRLMVEAGPRVVGVSFIRDQWEPELLPQPLQRGRVLTNDQVYMDHASVHSVQIGGPYEVTGTATATPSREEIFVCRPQPGAAEEACATQILSRMARRAYRRPATEQDVEILMEFFRQGRSEGGSFDAGVQLALERLVVDPEFLFRIYLAPSGVEPGDVYDLDAIAVASRLSFFLWSSIPDEPLLELAETGRLTEPSVLEEQVRRMLADPRAIEALVDGFAAQWLNLRLLPEKLADPLKYPDFDDSLLDAFQQETEMFVASNLREDRPITELLSADYTFANERLARFYGIPGVYGSRPRRVTLPNPDQRGGLLAHGGLLAITAYPDRTSPVLRGKWLLDNILGANPPPPPANVDTSLDQGREAEALGIRERLERHREDPLCASCHTLMDPLGFALEEFDAVGAWRDTDETGGPVDNLGTWPSGVELNGVASLRALLLDYDDQFVRTVTEKLMSYALGRPLEYYDQPTVRQIVRDAEAGGYRWSSIILGIAKSPAFLMRRSADPRSVGAQ
jgi:mono/diheme cytochrome c family protein